LDFLIQRIISLQKDHYNLVVFLWYNREVGVDKSNTLLEEYLN